MRLDKDENGFSLNHTTSQKARETDCLHFELSKGFLSSPHTSERLLFSHLNVAVLSLAGLAADGLGFSPGFEDLAEGTGDW